jgi:hypothetical protein
MYVCVYVCIYGGGYLRRSPVGQRVGSEQEEHELSKESSFLGTCMYVGNCIFVYTYVCLYVCIYVHTYIHTYKGAYRGPESLRHRNQQ